MQMERKVLESAVKLLGTIRPISKESHHVRLSTDGDGRMILSALGHGEIRIPVETDGGETMLGTVCPVPELQRALRVLPDGVVFVREAGSGLLIEHESGCATAEVRAVNGLFEASQYATPVDGGVGLDAADLAALLDRSAYAASTDEGRPALSQVLVTADGTTVESVATDGHRLAYARRPCLGEAVTVGVPTDTAKALASAIEYSGATTVLVSLTGSRAQVRAGDVCLWIPQMDSTFPEWRRVVPDPNGRQCMLVDRDALLDAVRAVAGMVDRQRMAVTLDIEPGRVRVSSAHDGGKAWRDVACEATANAVLGCNVKYLADALAAMPSGPMQIAYSDALAPLTFGRSDSEDFGLVMPMRL